MAQAMASMAGLRAAAQPVEYGTNLRGNSTRIPVPRSGFVVRASAESSEVTSRRGVLSLVATGLAASSFVQAVLAEGRPIKIGGPPPPSGGLPGTLNSDQARDFDLPLKERFYLQPLTPVEAAKRAKESAKEIVSVKEFIDKKAWPYVQNDLRARAGYLRFDLNTVISSKPKEEKQILKDLTGKLFQDIDNLDYAARMKSPTDAAKYYADTVGSLGNVLAKLG